MEKTIRKEKTPPSQNKINQSQFARTFSVTQEPQEDSEKLVIHNPAIGLKTPSPEDIYAVVKVDNRQYKVTKDCMILLDTKNTH
jgi:hypothetical protein